MNSVDERDICISYRDAKYQKLQERILADLYDCEVSDIRDILIRNGVYNPSAKLKSGQSNKGRAKGSRKVVRA